MEEHTIGIINAPWWLNHSHVLIREDMLAEDSAWIANQSTRLVGAGTANPQIEFQAGNTNIFLVKRMVVQGIVAVKRANDRVKTVHLPQEAEKLLSQDLDYIVAQINKHNQPMTEDEQRDFLPGVNGHSGTSLELVKPSPQNF